MSRSSSAGQLGCTTRAAGLYDPRPGPRGNPAASTTYSHAFGAAQPLARSPSEAARYGSTFTNYSHSFSPVPSGPAAGGQILATNHIHRTVYGAPYNFSPTHGQSPASRAGDGIHNRFTYTNQALTIDKIPNGKVPAQVYFASETVYNTMHRVPQPFLKQVTQRYSIQSTSSLTLN
jgi:hypothetical protein